MWLQSPPNPPSFPARVPLQSMHWLLGTQSRAPYSPPLPPVLCALQVCSLIPQNKQECGGFFFSSFFFPFLPFSTPPEPLLLVAGSPDSVGTQKCCSSEPWLPSWFRNLGEGVGGIKQEGMILCMCIYICIYIHIYILLIKDF